MSSDSNSSYCSTCSESHYNSSLSLTSLDDEDIDYTNHSSVETNGQLFYLKLIKDKACDSQSQQMDSEWPHMEDTDQKDKRSDLGYNDR